MSEAEKVYEQIKPAEPPPPIEPPEGGGDHEPERQKFSAAAAAISLTFMAGGIYLFVIGFRAVRHELALLGGKK